MATDDITVLVIEDNPGDFRLVSELLKSSGAVGFSITNAGTLAGAVELLARSRFDVILLDLNLPDSFGLETLDRIVYEFNKIPVIVLTGVSDEETGIEAVRRNAEDYLVKNLLQKDILIKAIRYSIERKRIREKLKESEQKYRELLERSDLDKKRLQVILETIPSGVIIVENPSGLIAFANRRANSLFGRELAAGGMTESPSELGLNKPDGTSLLAAELPITRARIGCETVRDFEILIKRPDGTSVFVTASAAPIVDETGVTAAVGAFEDISVRKEAQAVLNRDNENLQKLVDERSRELFSAHEKLEQSQRLSDIGQLASVVAHELRNPLGVMKLAVYNLKKKDIPREHLSHIGSIEKKISAAEQIVNNLLFYSRIRMPVHEKILIRELIEKCIDDCRAVRSGSTVRISLDSACGPDAVVEADPLQISEVFVNVINNAWDAVSDKSGRISIGAECDESQNRFTAVVRDNGKGIAHDELEMIFEPFFTKKSKGTGLGLPVCRQIVKAHGGTIYIKSAPGKGSEVFIILPLKYKP